MDASAGVRSGAGHLGTFLVFDICNEHFIVAEGRKGHLTGQIAAALMSKAAELLSEAPRIEQVDILASKIAGWS